MAAKSELVSPRTRRLLGPAAISPLLGRRRLLARRARYLLQLCLPRPARLLLLFDPLLTRLHQLLMALLLDLRLTLLCELLALLFKQLVTLLLRLLQPLALDLRLQWGHNGRGSCRRRFSRQRLPRE